MKHTAKYTIMILTAILSTQSLSAREETEYTHRHKPCICDKPIIFDETETEKLFELRGKVYKVLKGDDTNPSILYVLDPKTDKFIRIKQ